MRVKFLLFICLYTLLNTLSFGQCTATLTASAATICAGGSETLTVVGAAGGSVYKWKAGGTVVAGQTAATYTFTTTVTTTYTAIITNSSGCTYDSLATTITVNYAPLIQSFTASPDTLCSGDSASLVVTATAGGGTISTYTWSPAMGNVSSTKVAPTANTTYQVTVTNSDGCSVSSSLTVYPVPMVQTPIISAAGVNGQCGGRNQTFTVTNAQAGVTYSWNFGDGHTATGNPVTTQFPHGHGNTSTNYTVSVVATYGNTTCTSSASVVVGQRSIPDDILLDLIDNPQWTSCSGVGSIIVSDTATTLFQNYYIDWGDATNYNSATAPDSITHSYAAPGYYSVVYTVTSSNGCTESSSSTLYIGSNPHIGLTEPGATISLCTPITLAFPVSDVDSNTAGTIYVISSNDGSPTDTLYSPPTSYIHTFTTSSCGYTDVNGDPNSFYVQITATNPCSYSHATVDPITTNSLPVANFTVTPSSTDCTGSTVTITNTSSPGEYVSNSGNCDNTMITQWAITPNTGFTLTGNLGSSVWPTYSGSSANWGSTALNLVFTVPGTYSVKLTVRNKSTCGYDTIIKQICIQAPPTPLFTATPTLSCSPLVVTFTDGSITSNTCSNLVRNWVVTQLTQTCIQDSASAYAFSSGTNASSVNPVITFNNAGTYSVYLSMTNICGTFNSAAQTFTVYRRPQLSVSTQNICLGQTVTPTANVLVCGDSANTYSWSFTGGSPASSTLLSPGAISYAVTGTYPVTLSVQNECGTTLQAASIIVTSPSTVVLPPNDSVCRGATIPATNFSSVPAGATFTWTNSNTTIGLAASGAGNVPSFTAINNGTTILTATITVTPTISNCPGIAGIYTVTVYPNPTVTAPANITVCPGVSVPATSLTVNPAGTVFTWINSNTAIGLGASGTGNVPSFVSTNAGTTAISGTVTLTPSINGCPGTSTSYIITVNVQPVANVPANITVCPGTVITATTFTSTPTGATYTWTNSNPAIGLAASGNGNVPTFTGTNASNANISGTISVTPTLNGCSGPPSTYVITILAKPTVNLPVSDTLCPGTLVSATTFSSVPTGATYAWVNNNTTIGLAANGNGNVPAFTTTNATGAAIIGTITVTPTLAGCVGTPSSYKHTINPKPSMTTPASVILCSGASTTTTAFVSTPAGATFSWTNNNTGIGLGASGSGNIPAFIVTNITTASIVATITVTPVLNGCPGTPVSYTITVKPLPSVTVPVSDTICPGVAVPLTVLTSVPAGATFTWTNTNTAIGLGASGSGNVPAFTSSNNTVSPISGTVTVVSTLNGCAGPASQYTITVSLSPSVTVPANFTVCAGSPVAATSFTSNPTGATYTWTNTNTAIGLAASGTGNVPAFTSTNGGTTAISGTIKVTPNLNGCAAGTSSSYIITVNPLPAVNAVANINECAGVSIAALNFTSTPAGATYAWTNSNTAIGLAASGTGGLPAYIATNSTTTSITATITVTPTIGICSGPPYSFTITVNPIPVLTPLANDTVCSGTSVPAQVLTSLPAASSYAWTNTNTAIGLAANGAGNVPAFTSTNVTAAVITGTIKVTPTLNGCNGTAVSYNVLVYPKPVVTIANISTCPGSAIAASNFVSSPVGATFSWTSSSTANGLDSVSGTGNVPSFTAVNATNAAIVNTITVTPFLNGCPGTPVSYTITVKPLPTVVVPVSDTICPGVAVPLTVLTSVPAGATFTWTNTNTAIGLGASGNGNVPAFTSTNNTVSPISGTITVVPTLNGCVGPPSQYTVTVSLSPSVTVPANFTVCAGSPVAATSFTSNPPGATYTWTNTNTAIGLAASGNGDVPAFTSTNGGTTAISGTIKVTPNLNGCAAGTSSSYIITVNPLPVVNAVANIAECAGASIAALNFTSTPAGATYTWTNNNTAIGLAGSGTGGLPAYICTNPTTAPISATITVTPTTGGTCVGPPYNFTITVKPLPVVNLPASDTVCYGTAVPASVFTSIPAGATYTWVNNNPAIGLTSSGAGNVPGFTSANATNGVLVATITVTPTLTGCAGSPGAYTISVNPSPVVTVPASFSVCAGALVGATNFTSTTPGAIFTWTNSNPAIGIAASGTGNVPGFTAVNTTSGAISGTITVTPYINGCPGVPVSYVITVKPSPVVTLPGNDTICQGVLVASTVFTSVPAGATFTWTNNTIAIGLGANGTGNLPGFTATNSSNAPMDATITVIPTVNGCQGAPGSYIIQVNPLPVITVPASFTVCQDVLVPASNFTSNIAGTTFTWTNSNTGIGLPVGGNGNVPAFTAQNPTINTASGTITVSPSAGGCPGSSANYVITVKPAPLITANPNADTLCSSTLLDVVLTSSIPGTTVSWTVNQPVGVSGAAPGNGDSIQQVMANGTGFPQTVQYFIVSSSNGCNGLPDTVNVVINPGVILQFSTGVQTICSGQSTQEVYITSSVAGTPLIWTSNASGVTGVIASGTDSIPVQTLVNNTSFGIVVDYDFIAGYPGCQNTTATYDIIVNPPSTAIQQTAQTVCSGLPSQPIVINSNAIGVNYAWVASSPDGITGFVTSDTGTIIASQTYVNPLQTAGIVVYTVSPAANGCPGQSVNDTITVKPSPIVNPIPDQIICNGGTTNTIYPATTLPGTIFDWNLIYNGNITGYIITGTDSIPSQTLANPGLTTDSLIYNIAPSNNGCNGPSYNTVIVVNPFPDVILPAGQSICSGSTSTVVVLSSHASGATFTWTATAAAGITGYTASGTGDINAQTLLNSTNTSATVTYTVIASANGCGGTPFIYVVTVKPIPVAIALPDTICSGAQTSVPITSNISDAAFTWTVTMPASITGGTGGSGTDIQDNLINTSAAPQTVLYIITPSDLGCTGPADSVAVVVNPGNNVQFSLPNQTICSGQNTQPVTITGTDPGGAFPWTCQPNGISGAIASGIDSIPAQTLINNTNLPLAVIYTVSLANGSCPTNPANYEVVVNPTPVANQPAPQTVCSDIASQVVELTSSVNGSTFSWVGASPDGVTGFTASDDSIDIIPSQILTNASATTGIVIYTITPSSSGCPGLAVYDTISVLPLPVINPVAGQTICSGSPSAVFNPASSIPGTIFNWRVIYYGNITGYTSSGTGSIPSVTLVNSGVSADSVLFEIIPVAAGCTGAPYDYKIIVNPGPDVLLPPAQTICSGSSTNLVTLTSDAGVATFSWTATATANVTGFTAAGAGNIPVQTLSNSGTTAGLVTYAITAFANGCTGLVYNYDVTVKPLPVATALPSPDTICSSTQTNIALSSTIANTSFSWTATEPVSVIGATSGTGNNIQQVLVNNNAAPQTVIYSVVPNAIGCPGVPLAVSVVVNPVPDVLFNPSPQSVCSGQPTQLVNITSTTPGATFSWTSQANGATGIAAAGTNTIPVQTPGNNGIGYDTALYFVTAAYLNCPGLSATYDIVVNPVPQVILPAAQIACPGVATNPVVLGSAPAGATFAWTGSSPNGITGFSPSGTGSPIPAQILSNTGSTAGTVVFAVTASANGCTGPPANYNITVNPSPVVTLPQPQTICSGTSFATVILSSNITGTTYTWTSLANAAITGNLASGSGNITSQTLNNSGNLPDTVTYVVSPLANACNGMPAAYYVIVEPVPAVIFAPQPQTICSGQTSLPVTITSSTPGVSITWNAVVPNDITGAATSGTNSIPAQTLFNSLVDTFPVGLTVTYTAIATTATSGCPGLPANYTITVEPLPVISFNQTATNGCSPLSVDFMPATMNYGVPDTLVFNWGDGSANTTVYPSGVAPQWYPVNHTFYNDSTIPLTFNITLVARGRCADTSVVRSVTILPNRISAFFAASPTSGCAPLTVALHDESTGPGTLSWCLNYNRANDSCMGAGRIDTVGTTFNYTFAAGTYTVALFVQNGFGCAHDSAFQTINVSPSPIADFAFANDSCAQTPVRFNNLSIIPPGTAVTEYDWNFGTGDSSLQTVPVYTYDSSGTYNVCLNVTIAGGCRDSICKPVTVLYKPVANFSNEDTCANTQPTIFVNSSVGAGTYTWDFGDGNTSALPNPDHYYSASGNYHVTLISFTNACSDTIIKPVTVYPVPVAAFTAPGPYTCGVPANLQLTNTSTGAVSYAWNFGNGTSSTNNNPVATYNAPGTFSITLSASTHLGCVDTVQHDVQIYAYPSLQSVNIDPAQGCQPLYVQFAVNASDANSYLWNFGDGSPSVTGPGATAHTYTNTGSYSVTLVMYSFGTCGDTVLLPDTINVYANPTANFEYDMNATIDSAIGTVQFINTSSNSNSYVWSFGDGDSSSLVNPAHTYPGIDYFNVELLAVNQYGCRDSIDKSVYVIKKSLYVPNAFAPEYTNGSALVQVWKPAGMGLSSYHAQVFDKWGELLWESTAITADDMKMPVEGWDGTYQGKLCQQDVYVWKVEAVFVDGTVWPGMSYKFQKEKKTIGSVTLVR